MYKINIPVGVIESNCVNNVAMTLQCVKFFSRRCVPNFTCSIVTTSNEALKKQNCVILEKKKRVINLKRNLFHVINSESCNACCYWKLKKFTYTPSQFFHGILHGIQESQHIKKLQHSTLVRHWTLVYQNKLWLFGQKNLYIIRLMYYD